MVCEEIPIDEIASCLAMTIPLKDCFVPRNDNGKDEIASCLAMTMARRQ
ncbi:MAG: hypothetical protein JSS98_10015 [Bacteroidetes bacterium]|nr:hypothetical protein [Bacteroidota bacterium]